MVSPEDWKERPVKSPPLSPWNKMLPSVSVIMIISHPASINPESIVKFKGDPSELTYSNCVVSPLP